MNHRAPAPDQELLALSRPEHPRPVGPPASRLAVDLKHHHEVVTYLYCQEQPREALRSTQTDLDQDDGLPLTERILPDDPPAGFEVASDAFASGVTLVTVADGREDIGVTVSAFCPVSVRPPLISIALIAGSYPAELLGRLDRFAVTVLASGQRVLAGRFSAKGRPGARLLLDDVPHQRGDLSGALIPDEGLAAMECQVVSQVPAGDHVLVIAHVLFVLYTAESGDPLVRFHRRYRGLATA